MGHRACTKFSVASSIFSRKSKLRSLFRTDLSLVSEKHTLDDQIFILKQTINCPRRHGCQPRDLNNMIFLGKVSLKNISHKNVFAE